MSDGVWLMLAFAPLALAPLCVAPATRAWAFALAPWSALPALALALFGPFTIEWQAPALLEGLALGVDAVGHAFLLFTAVVGLLAGWFMQAELRSDARRFRFTAFYLTALGGNLGAILAQDVVSFYSFYALMAFSAYGLVIHRQDAAARRAGQLYIALVVLGEGMLLAALILVAGTGSLALADVPQAVATSPYRGWIIALLLGGFGTKAGLLPLHVSLPVAYAAAPVSGAVLLAGAMINAGLLGWLRFLPLGFVPLPDWGAVLALAGVTAMFLGVLVGLVQVNAKAMLAYSSISQMGFMTVALGLTLLAPPLARLTLPALLVYAAHHAIVKAALFTGLGVAAAGARRTHVVAALAFPSLVLAGAPFTSGAIAKYYLKEVVHQAPAAWSMLEPVLSAGALATGLLMLRFLHVVWREPRAPAKDPPVRSWLVFFAALIASAGYVWLLPQVEPAVLREHWRGAGALWSALWPVFAAVAVAVLAFRFARAPQRAAWIPPGDWAIAVGAIARDTVLVWRRFAPFLEDVMGRARRRRIPQSVSRPILVRWHRGLQSWPLPGMLFLLLIVAMFLLLMPLSR